MLWITIEKGDAAREGKTSLFLWLPVIRFIGPDRMDCLMKHAQVDHFGR